MKLRGLVKFYDSEKEYGFIIADDGGSDIFFTRRAIVGDALPAAKDVVYFDVHKNRVGRVSASNIELVDR